MNPHFPPVQRAYIRLCTHVESSKKWDRYRLSSYREYQYAGIQLLEQKKVNLVFTVSNNMTVPSMAKELKERRMIYKKISDLPCQVNLSVNHPLILNNCFSLQKLRDYPFVEYVIEGDRGSPYNRMKEVSFINLSKLIRVDSGNARTQIVASTDAYSVGVAMPPEWGRENGICSIAIPEFYMELGCIRRAGEAVSELEELLMDYLMQEIQYTL